NLTQFDKFEYITGDGEQPRMKTKMTRLKIADWLSSTFSINMEFLLEVPRGMFIKLGLLNYEELQQLAQKVAEW
ncbi:7663_t:CDS:1, partial [Ambispora gerdemannii]